MIQITKAHFRKLGMWEGISLLILLILAMPLKYYYGMPLAVRIIGSLHGLLFTLYLIYGFLNYKKFGWNLVKLFFAYLSSVIPFGFLIFDKFLFGKNLN